MNDWLSNQLPIPVDKLSFPSIQIWEIWVQTRVIFGSFSNVEAFKQHFEREKSSKTLSDTLAASTFFAEKNLRQNAKKETEQCRSEKGSW